MLRVVAMLTPVVQDKILKNKKAGLHTLCLLDIKVKEQTATRNHLDHSHWMEQTQKARIDQRRLMSWAQVENLMRGRKIYEPPRFMTVT